MGFSGGLVGALLVRFALAAFLGNKCSSPRNAPLTTLSSLAPFVCINPTHRPSSQKDSL